MTSHWHHIFILKIKSAPFMSWSDKLSNQSPLSYPHKQTTTAKLSQETLFRSRYKCVCVCVNAWLRAPSVMRQGMSHVTPGRAPGVCGLEFIVFQLRQCGMAILQKQMQRGNTHVNMTHLSTHTHRLSRHNVIQLIWGMTNLVCVVLFNLHFKHQSIL